MCCKACKEAYLKRRLHFNHLLYCHACADTFSSNVQVSEIRSKHACWALTAASFAFVKYLRRCFIYLPPQLLQLSNYCFFLSFALSSISDTHYVFLGFISSRSDCSDCLKAALPNLYRSLPYKS